MGFQLTHKNRYTAKDQNKATIANKYIGFSVSGKGRATEQYAIDAATQNIPVNCGTYTASDVVFVSLNGVGYGTAANFYKTLAEIDVALQAGASIITDNATNAYRNYNNHAFSEAGLRMHLRKTYRHIEEIQKQEMPYSIWKLTNAFRKLSHLNKLFIEQALSTPSYWLDNSKNHELFERKWKLNNSFDFNTANIDQLDKINKMFDLKSKQAYEQAQKIEAHILREMQSENSFVSDYEIDFEVRLFAEKKYAAIEEMEGNSFFSSIPGIIPFTKKEHFLQEHYDWLLFANHNEYQYWESHPLKNQFHCAAFHDLYDHTYLAWQDIIDTEEVWIEVVVRIQNFSDILHN